MKNSKHKLILYEKQKKSNGEEEKMISIKNKKQVTCLLIIFSLFVALIPATSYAASKYENSRPFVNVALPHVCDNVTLATAEKSTDRDYGKAEITKIGGGSCGVNCWFRSKVNGEWKHKTGDVAFFTTTGEKRIDYQTAYVKGTTVQLRAENNTSTQFVKDKVSGEVWFN